MEIRVEASPDAAGFIQERGGRLFAWTDESDLLHTTFEAPEGDVEFERLWCDGFEFNLDTSIKVPDEGVWYVLFHRYPWHHVEATPYKRIDLAFS